MKMITSIEMRSNPGCRRVRMERRGSVLSGAQTRGDGGHEAQDLRPARVRGAPLLERSGSPGASPQEGEGSSRDVLRRPCSRGSRQRGSGTLPASGLRRAAVFRTGGLGAGSDVLREASLPRHDGHPEPEVPRAGLHSPAAVWSGGRSAAALLRPPCRAAHGEREVRGGGEWGGVVVAGGGLFWRGLGGRGGVERRGCG